MNLILQRIALALGAVAVIMGTVLTAIRTGVIGGTQMVNNQAYCAQRAPYIIFVQNANGGPNRCCKQSPAPTDPQPCIDIPR